MKDDGDSGCRRGRDGGQPRAVEPPACYPPGCPGRDARYRAVGSLLVAPGQGRGTLAEHDPEAPDLVAEPAPAGLVDNDLLDVRPRDEHGRAARQRPHGPEHDARTVGTERDGAEGRRDHHWYREQEGEHGPDQVRVPEEAEAERQQARGQAQDGAGQPVAFFVAARIRPHPAMACLGPVHVFPLPQRGPDVAPLERSVSGGLEMLLRHHCGREVVH